MVTQLAEAPADTGQDDSIGNADVIERDYEAEARAHYWLPKEEFKGDKSRWVDAETFVKRADEILPLVKKQNSELKGKVDYLERQIKRVMKSEQTAYENALADIQAKMENAVVTGDVAAFKALDKKADDLRKDMAQDTPKADQSKEAVRAFADWRDDNEWYDLGGLASATETERKQRAYFDRMVEGNMDKAAEMQPAEFIAYIGDLVEAKYPAGKAARPRGVESVAGVTRGGQGKSGKTGANLPTEAKEAVRRYMRQGIYKGTFEESCNAFAKDFDWSGT